MNVKELPLSDPYYKSRKRVYDYVAEHNGHIKLPSNFTERTSPSAWSVLEKTELNGVKNAGKMLREMDRLAKGEKEITVTESQWEPRYYYVLETDPERINSKEFWDIYNHDILKLDDIQYNLASNYKKRYDKIMEEIEKNPELKGKKDEMIANLDALYEDVLKRRASEVADCFKQIASNVNSTNKYLTEYFGGSYEKIARPSVAMRKQVATETLELFKTYLKKAKQSVNPEYTEEINLQDNKYVSSISDIRNLFKLTDTTTKFLWEANMSGSDAQAYRKTKQQQFVDLKAIYNKLNKTIENIKANDVLKEYIKSTWNFGVFFSTTAK